MSDRNGAATETTFCRSGDELGATGIHGLSIVIFWEEMGSPINTSEENDRINCVIKLTLPHDNTGDC